MDVSTGNQIRLESTKPVLLRDDPLFGVLTEKQVGMDKRTGSPKIAKEVLDTTRLYLQVQDSA